MRTYPLVCVLAVALVPSLLGCGGEVADTENPNAYAKDGLQFEMPGNWEVTEDAEAGPFRYLFVEEPGDALVVVQLFPAADAADLRGYAEGFSKQSAAATKTGTLSASSFGNVSTSDGYEMLTETFSISLMGETVPHTRNYRRKVCGAHVCFVIAQVADEDRADVVAGFTQLVSSLTYKAP